MIKDQTYWINKLNELEKPPKNKYDKGGTYLLRCMEYYNVMNLRALTAEQIEEFYYMVKRESI